MTLRSTTSKSRPAPGRVSCYQTPYRFAPCGACSGEPCTTVPEDVGQALERLEAEFSEP